jgi:SAM-dependent methyltransferase
VKRSLQPELMDSPDITLATLEQFHRDLKRVHSLLGTFATVKRFLQRDTKPVSHVLDVGCGGGTLLKYLRRSMDVQITGVDRVPPPGLDFPFVTADACIDTLPPADVAVSTMMAHHLTPAENVALIRNVGRSCRRFLILDLVRHPLPLTLFSVFVCPLIGHEAGADGRQSIRRAFTPAEFSELVTGALTGTKGRFSMDVSFFRSRQIIDIRY